MTGVVQAATAATAIGCGLCSGVFFAFSSFVMPALDRLAPPRAIAAMQAMNEAAVTPAFMTALFGTAAACTAMGIVAVSRWGEPAAAWVLAGAALFLVGSIGVTVAANVPLNDALGRIVPDAADAAARWSDFARDWTAWNHVRTGASVGAAALLTVALVRGG